MIFPDTCPASEFQVTWSPTLNVVYLLKKHAIPYFGEIGYSTSADGIHRAHETRVQLQFPQRSVGDPGDNRNFYAVGKCSLAWQ